MDLAHACLLALAAVPAQESEVRAAQPRLGACVLQLEEQGEPTGAAFGPDGALYVSDSLAHEVRVFDAAGKPLRTLGKELLADPRDVAVCADGRVVVSDSGLAALVVFAPDGRVLRFGKRGSGPGELDGCEGLDVEGELAAVADARNDRVQVFRLDGTYVGPLGARGEGERLLAHPSDVAFAPGGRLFVADLFHQRVQCFAQDGKLVRAFGSPGPNPGQFSGPTGLAVRGGSLHVVDRDNGRVQMFTLEGELQGTYGIHALRPREGRGKLHDPLRIALDALGTRAALVEPLEGRVQVLGPVEPGAEELPPLPGLAPSHFGGALDADGPLLVATQPSIPRVQLFRMVDGEPVEIAAFGTYGSRPGQLIWPGDVALDLARRRIYVADFGAQRIQSYAFRFEPGEELRFDAERVRFVAEVDLHHVLLPEFMDAFRPADIEPAGLWRDGEGGLCIADARKGCVWRFDARLEATSAFAAPQGARELRDGCAGPKDAQGRREQYAVDRLGGRVFALSAGKAVADGLVRPSAVLSSSAGALYVSDEGAHALLRPGSEHRVVARGPGLGPMELVRPRGLAELPGGRIAVLDFGNHRGLIFDRDDEFLRAFGSQLFIRPTFASQAAKTAEPALELAPAPKAPAFPPLDGTRAWHALAHCASNDGTYAVFWNAAAGPIEFQKTFALTVFVTPLAEPNVLAQDLQLAFDAAMPEHGHGMNVAPRSTRSGEGQFLVEGAKLHMPGRWELYFDLATDGRTERAQVTLELE